MTVCVGDPFLLEIQALTLTSNSNNTTQQRCERRFDYVTQRSLAIHLYTKSKT